MFDVHLFLSAMWYPGDVPEIFTYKESEVRSYSFRIAECGLQNWFKSQIHNLKYKMWKLKHSNPKSASVVSYFHETFDSSMTFMFPRNYTFSTCSLPPSPPFPQFNKYIYLSVMLQFTPNTTVTYCTKGLINCSASVE